MVQSSPAEVTGLHPGTEYQMFVASVNAIIIGTGEYCCESSAIYVRTSKGSSVVLECKTGLSFMYVYNMKVSLNVHNLLFTSSNCCCLGKYIRKTV